MQTIYKWVSFFLPKINVAHSVQTHTQKDKEVDKQTGKKSKLPRT